MGPELEINNRMPGKFHENGYLLNQNLDGRITLKYVVKLSEIFSI